MTLPDRLKALRLPLIAAPMFLTSGPDLVIEACKAGIVGTFPALNQRTTEGFRDWVRQIKTALAGVEGAAPFGVNLIVHKSNPRLEADLAVCIEEKVPLIITSLGAVAQLVDAVHGYGGIVFHDVINARHGRSAARAGVDGLIAVAAGAGGHAGTTSPFALLSELRGFFDGTILLAGAMNKGSDVAAARLMGADLAYMGTRFIATKEAMVPQEQKQMILDTSAADVLYTDSISGVNANFLRPSIEAAGLDPDDLPEAKAMDMAAEARAWKDVWSAGQGVGGIDDIPSVAELVARIDAEYQQAMKAAVQDHFVRK